MTELRTVAYATVAASSRSRAVLPGLSWQHTRGSALIGFIKDDAAFVAEKIEEHQQSTRPAQPRTAVGAGEPSEARSRERS